MLQTSVTTSNRDCDSSVLMHLFPRVKPQRMLVPPILVVLVGAITIAFTNATLWRFHWTGVTSNVVRLDLGARPSRAQTYPSIISAVEHEVPHKQIAIKCSLDDRGHTATAVCVHALVVIRVWANLKRTVGNTATAFLRRCWTSPHRH
jgi:hypothetical protein